MTAEKILTIARGELGTKESPANSNNVKYNTAYYGKAVSGGNYAWCAVFVWWCFKQAGASSLYYGGGKTAYCPTLMSFHKAQAVSGDYEPGDIIFFNFKGGTGLSHVGICESWDGKNITTIDGNTGSGNQANGGAVLRQKRDKKYIVNAYRPNYQKEEPELTEAQAKQIAQEAAKTICAQMLAQNNTYEQFLAYMKQYRAELGAQKQAIWAASAIQKCIDAGIMSDVGGTIERPCDLLTRQEAAVMAAGTLDAAKNG